MKKAKRTNRRFSVQDKMKAVLSIWTERRSSSEVCKAMSISWTLLSNWQELAMEGMMKALEAKSEGKRPALNMRLERMLEKKVLKMNSNLSKIGERLSNIQEKSRKNA